MNCNSESNEYNLEIYSNQCNIEQNSSTTKWIIGLDDVSANNPSYTLRDIYISDYTRSLDNTIINESNISGYIVHPNPRAMMSKLYYQVYLNFEYISEIIYSFDKDSGLLFMRKDNYDD